MELQKHHQAIISTKRAKKVSSTSGISDVTVKSLRHPVGI